MPLIKKTKTSIFKSQNFQAIEEVCDSCVLYTNRALTNLHLERYNEVLDDCKTALRINPGSLKAMVYKARAHRALGHHELAVQSTQEAVNLHPNHKAFIRHAVLRENIVSPTKDSENKNEGC
jgi:tetratricopeptide (TPR) repeat protein